MVRRVVTGHDDAGKSVVVSDDEVEANPIGTGGTATWFVWGRDGTAHYPDGGEQQQWSEPFPPVGGCRISVVRLAPGSEEEFDRFVAEALPKWADKNQPGMHRTASLDFDVVISGEVVLELDDGLEVALRAGDIVVQNGTRHRWYNRGATDAVFAAVLIGAENDLAG